MLKWNLKAAWNNVLRHRSSSLINISGLAIGMTAAVFIFVWVQNELNFDTHHKDAERIFRLKHYLSIDKNSTWIWENSPYILGRKAKDQIPEVEAVARYRPMEFDAPTIFIGVEAMKDLNAATVDTNWFDVFTYKVLNGSISGFKQHPQSVVITESKALKYFNTVMAAGQTLRIDTVDFKVQAVVADNPPNSSFRSEIFLPMTYRHQNPAALKNDEEWGNFNYLTFLRLSPGAAPGSIASKISAIYTKERDRKDHKAGLINIKELRFENDLQQSVIEHGNRKAVAIFAFLGFLLLGIACINYINLTTARATLRAREVSIKKIVGAERKQLIAQFLLESALISLLALLLSMLLVRISLPVFNAVAGRDYPLFGSSSLLWTTAAGVLLLTVLLSSIYPAVLLSSFKPLSAFRGYNALRIKDTVLRKGLVVTQFTISIVLIVGTIVVYRQLNYINTQQTAYNKSQLFTFFVPYRQLMKTGTEEAQRSLLNTIYHELASETAVRQVSRFNQDSPINMQGFSSGDNNDWDGRDKEFMPAISFISTDSAFPKLLNMQLVSGRWFNFDNPADAHNSILNETAVKEFGIRQPVIGQRFTAQGDTGVVIGVVKDFYYRSFHEKIGPVVMRGADNYRLTFLVQSAPGRHADAVKASERIWKKFFPSAAFEPKFVDEEFASMYESDRRMAKLIWGFSGIAIFLSCLGLFGLAAFTAERRTKEIGIRKVVGASVTDIVTLLSKEFVYLVLIALLIASPIAWWAMNKWLEDFVYRINMHYLFFVVAGILSLAVALLTVSLHAFRAAVKNPVDTLRTE